jgi:hypothetical protein
MDMKEEESEMKTLDQELVHNEVATKRWQSRLKRAMTMLDKLNKRRNRLMKKKLVDIPAARNLADRYAATRKAVEDNQYNSGRPMFDDPEPAKPKPDPLAAWPVPPPPDYRPEPPKEDIPTFLLREPNKKDEEARAEVRAEQEAEKKRKAEVSAEKREIKEEVRKAELTGKRRKMPLSGKAAMEQILGKAIYGK